MLETAVTGSVPKAAKGGTRSGTSGGSAPASRRDLGEDFAPRRTSGPVGARLQDEEDFAPSGGFGGLRFRLRGGVPRSVVGRVLAGGVVLAALVGTIAGILGLRGLLMASPRLVLESSAGVQITGNSHLTRAQLLTVFGEDVDRNILTVPLVERRAMLERLPWVEHATVMRLLPNRFRVAIIERKPVAFVRQGSRIGLVDKNGVLLDMASDGDASSETGTETHYSFPVLAGISADEPLSVRAARMKLFARFTAELGDRAKTVSEIDLSNPEDVKALIPDGNSDILVHFGEKDFLHRYELYEKNLPGWKTAYPKLASADMRYERQVVLEMQPGSAVPANEKGAEEKTKVSPPKAMLKTAKASPVNPSGAETAPPVAATLKPSSPSAAIPNLGQKTGAATPPRLEKVPGIGSSAQTKPPSTGHLTKSFDVKSKAKATQVDLQ